MPGGCDVTGVTLSQNVCYNSVADLNVRPASYIHCIQTHWWNKPHNSPHDILGYTDGANDDV